MLFIRQHCNPEQVDRKEEINLNLNANSKKWIVSCVRESQVWKLFVIKNDSGQKTNNQKSRLITKIRRDRNRNGNKLTIQCKEVKTKSCQNKRHKSWMAIKKTYPKANNNPIRPLLGMKNKEKNFLCFLWKNKKIITCSPGTTAND